jgi:hypothetical protein
MECKVSQVIPTGEGGGAGILILCEVVLMHVSDSIIDSTGRIDPFKLDAVARLGGDYYARIQGENIFTVPKPLDRLGMGIDQLPPSIRTSKILSGNDLGMLANVEVIPEKGALLPHEYELASKGELELHRLAKRYLADNKVADAWRVLVSR